MNSCEIKIVNEVKNSGDVKTLVGLLKESNPTFSESELESKINELVSISNNTISTNATEDLQSFFTTSNGKHNLAYNAVKLKVIDKIFEQIFNSDEIADNNRNLNLSLKFLQNRLKSERGYKQGNNKDIIDLFNILRDKDSYLDDESNYDMLADYLIINHLDLVIKA